MKAKKLFGILLAGAMALSAVAGLAACGGKNDPGKESGDGLKYYVVGGNANNSTASYLYTVSNWATEHKAELEMVKEEGTNKYSIELDLIAGDEFKIVSNEETSSFWDSEMGFSKLVTGKNDKDEDVFMESGQYGGNICLQEGFDGRYKFTYENNSITWELLEKFEMVTVTYKDGETVLNTQSVKKGAKLEESDLFVPAEKILMTFDGWYNGNDLYEGGVVNEALTLTAKFTELDNEAYVADTNEYYLVGAGQGSLKDSNWNIGKDDNGDDTVLPEGLFLKKDESYKQHNVYTIEVTLYAGDQFKIAHGRSWDGAFNIINLIEADVGTSAFEGEDNIGLKSGRDGKYKLILVTDENNVGVYYEFIEAVTPLKMDYYLVGTYYAENGDNWGDDASAEWTIHLTEGKNNEWTCTVTITEENYPSWSEAQNPAQVPAAALKVKLAGGADYGVAELSDMVTDQNGTAGSQNIFLTAGTYKITFNSETKEISWELVNEEPAE